MSHVSPLSNQKNRIELLGDGPPNMETQAIELKAAESLRRRAGPSQGPPKWRDLYPLFLNSNVPPWHPLPSREVGRLLGVSLQTLANWRVRNSGPEPEPMQMGKGNRIHYRPDKVLAFVDELSRSYWEFSACWLEARGLWVGIRTQRDIDARIAEIDRLDIPW